MNTWSVMNFLLYENPLLVLHEFEHAMNDIFKSQM
jgi:hypothetical protein